MPRRSLPAKAGPREPGLNPCGGARSDASVDRRGAAVPVPDAWTVEGRTHEAWSRQPEVLHGERGFGEPATLAERVGERSPGRRSTGAG